MSSTLQIAASVCFVPLILALPWSIAPMTIAAILCGFLTLIQWLKAPLPRREWSPVAIPALGWLAAMLLSASFALDRSASLSRLGKGLLPALVPLAAYHTARRAHGQRALGLLLISSAAASLYGIFFFVAHSAQFASRARGPVGHYMTFGGQLLLLVSLCAGVALMAPTLRWRLAAASAGGLGALALAGTFTRSAWLGLFASLVVMVAAIRPRRLPFLLLAVAALYFAAPPTYRDRLVSSFEPNHPGNRERTLMWQAGVRMFRDHPVTGIGLQDLKPAYQRYRDPTAKESAGHLHSVPIHVAATMGVVGLVAFAILYGSLFRAAGLGLATMLRQGGLAAGVRLGVLGGLAGFLVAGLFVWNLGDEELLYLLYVLVGMAWGARSSEPPGGEDAPR